MRTRFQREKKESIRDFASSYRALCKRWKTNLTESDIVKLILKNIKSYLASQLCSQVNTVEGLVKLGHLLKKDSKQQLWYKCHMGIKHPPHPAMLQRSSSNRPEKEKIPVQCQQYNPSQSPLSSCLQVTSHKHPYSSQVRGVQSSHNSVTATQMQKSPSITKKASTSSNSDPFMTVRSYNS